MKQSEYSNASRELKHLGSDLKSDSGSEKALEQLFSAARCEFEDNDLFLQNLSARLDKVEYIKDMQKAQKRGHRFNLLLAFVAGALSMCVVIMLLPYLPTDLQILNLLMDIGTLTLFPAKAKIISTILVVTISYALCFSLASIFKDVPRQADF